MAKFVEVRDEYWVNVDSISHFERKPYGVYEITFEGIQMTVDEDRALDAIKKYIDEEYRLGDKEDDE